MTTPAQMPTRIRTRALEAGLHKVGIVRAEALVPERQRLEQWLHRGLQGEMGWMARDPEQRADPRELFPEARSVIAVAINYYTPAQHSDNPATGKVSRYAWRDHYHDIV